MGTNYYINKVLCKHCGSKQELHIGKSSFGWTFSFQAYEGSELEPKILSYKDWLKYLNDNPELAIEDEYGEIVTLREFKKIVREKKKEPKSHTIWCQQYFPLQTDNFLDEEGNSMSLGYFT